jgi:hypothetical protein
VVLSEIARIGVLPLATGLAQAKTPPLGMVWLATAAPLILTSSGCPVRFSMRPASASVVIPPKGTL